MTINTNHVAALSVDRRLSLWTQWIAIRNGGLNDVDRILSPMLTAHFPRGGGRHERTGGRADLISWVTASRTAFSEFSLRVEVGPILGVHLVAGRWVQSGMLRSGAVVRATGVDIIRVDDGRVTEFWVNHDHLGALASAA